MFYLCHLLACYYHPRFVERSPQTEAPHSSAHVLPEQVFEPFPMPHSFCVDNSVCICVQCLEPGLTPVGCAARFCRQQAQK